MLDGQRREGLEVPEPGFGSLTGDWESAKSHKA